MEKAAAAPNPASIFGLSTPRRLVEFFTLGPLGHSTYKVQQTLRDLVIRANGKIQQTFSRVGESYVRRDNNGTEEEHIYGRAHFDAGCVDRTEYYTYMSVPAKTPFSGTATIAGESAGVPNTLRDVDTEDAFPELMTVLWEASLATTLTP